MPRGLWVAILGLAILANLVQVFTLDKVEGEGRDGRGKHLRAIYVNDSEDILVLFRRLTNVSAVHNLYFALREHTRGATLEVPPDPAFKNGTDFVAGVVGVGGISDIQVRTTIPAVSKRRLDRFTVASGEIWKQPGHARAGLAGITWQIALRDGSKPGRLILIYDKPGRNYLIADEELLLSLDRGEEDAD